MSLNQNVFDTVILPQLVEPASTQCKANQKHPVRCRTTRHPVYPDMVLEEHWCVSCKRIVSEYEGVAVRGDPYPDLSLAA